MVKFIGGCRYCDAPFFDYGEEIECDHKSDCTRPGPVDDTEMSSHEISIHNAALEEAIRIADEYMNELEESAKDAEGSSQTLSDKRDFAATKVYRLIHKMSELKK